MDNICQKSGCVYEKIPRGKYCDLHRSRKKQIIIKEPVRLPEPDDDLREAILRSLEFEKQKKDAEILETRLLREEQQLEFEEAMKADLEKIKLEKIAELSKQIWFEDKKKSLKDEPTTDCFNIKINMPSGFKIVRKFHNDVTIGEIRDFVDVHLYENNSLIVNYELVINIPYLKFTPYDNAVMLKNISAPRSLVFYLHDLDV